MRAVIFGGRGSYADSGHVTARFLVPCEIRNVTGPGSGFCMLRSSWDSFRYLAIKHNAGVSLGAAMHMHFRSTRRDMLEDCDEEPTKVISVVVRVGLRITLTYHV